MNERYIAMSGDGLYGHWGAGDTAEDARKKLKKAGGKVEGCILYRFTSELPFAAADKKVADDTEADCWVGRDGSMNWIRCKREEVAA